MSADDVSFMSKIGSNQQHGTLQQDLDMLQQCSNRWLMNFNLNEYLAMKTGKKERERRDQIPKTEKTILLLMCP